MPQVSSLTLPAASLTDSAVDEVYDVVDRKDGVTTLRFAGTGPMSLASIIKVTVKQPTSNSQYWRVRIQFTKPESFTDADTGIVAEHLANHATLEFQMNKKSTLAQAASHTERVLATLALTDVQSAINGAENFY